VLGHLVLSSITVATSRRQARPRKFSAIFLDINPRI
jgi:hypothetical protein